MNEFESAFGCTPEEYWEGFARGITPSIRREARALSTFLDRYKAPETKGTLEDLFSCAPESGDFQWESSEAGDWYVYRCGDKDCDRQWHRTAYGLNMGREDGKRWAELWSVNEDGDTETEARWDEGDPWEDGMLDQPSNQEHWLGWAQYWLDCLETGDDPCGQMMTSSNSWAVSCLGHALGYARPLGYKPE